MANTKTKDTDFGIGMRDDGQLDVVSPEEFAVAKRRRDEEDALSVDELYERFQAEEDAEIAALEAEANDEPVHEDDEE